jgi:hypothetical protein
MESAAALGVAVDFLAGLGVNAWSHRLHAGEQRVRLRYAAGDMRLRCRSAQHNALARHAKLAGSEC